MPGIAFSDERGRLYLLLPVSVQSSRHRGLPLALSVLSSLLPAYFFPDGAVCLSVVDWLARWLKFSFSSLYYHLPSYGVMLSFF